MGRAYAFLWAMSVINNILNTFWTWMSDKTGIEPLNFSTELKNWAVFGTYWSLIFS